MSKTLDASIMRCHQKDPARHILSQPASPAVISQQHHSLPILHMIQILILQLAGCTDWLPRAVLQGD